MVMLHSEPDHHRNEEEVHIKDGLSLIRGQHGHKEDLPILNQVGRGIEGDAQTVSPLADLFMVGSDLVEGKNHFRCQK